MFCFHASNKMLNKHSNIKSDAQTSAPPSSKATGIVSPAINIFGAAACSFCSSQRGLLSQAALKNLSSHEPELKCLYPWQEELGAGSDFKLDVSHQQFVSPSSGSSTQLLSAGGPLAKAVGGYYPKHCGPERVLGSTGFRPTGSTFMKEGR